jgi:hypothetical protein
VGKAALLPTLLGYLAKYCLSQSNLAQPNDSISFQLSKPQITASKVSKNISGIGCHWFRSM